MMNNQQFDASQAKKWISIYPAYIDKDKTIDEGRRIPKEKSVSAPNILEIGEICSFYKLNFIIEPKKAYPKDWLNPGRVKVELFKEDTPINPELISKKAFMLKLGELIPKLKSRVQSSQPVEEVSEVSTGGKRKKKNK